MDNERLLTISEFSRLAAISRKNLIFYDQARLFHPAEVGANGYRLYTLRQLQTVDVIAALREIGVPLKDIRTYLDNRTPDRLLALCASEADRVLAEIDTLGRILEMLRNIRAATVEGRSARPGTFRLVDMAEERLFMGPELEAADDYALSNAFTAFYRQCAEHGLSHCLPYGSLTAKKTLLAKGRKSFPPARFFCAAPEDFDSAPVVVKPAGRYAVGYDKGGYGELTGLYRGLLRFVAGSGLAVAGDAYETYLLNEIAVRDPDGYLARVEVRVE